LAERLTINSVSVKSAYLRPIKDPMSSKIDVTRGFSALVCKEFMLTERAVTAQELMCVSASAGTNNFYKMFWFGAKAPPAHPITGSWWLCVAFSVPGGTSYTSCYAIPEEKVTFPPVMSNSSKMIMSLNRQVVSSAIVMENEDHHFNASPSKEKNTSSPSSDSAESDEEEEEEEMVVLDITRQSRSMLGPDGTAFGRGWIDVRLAVADAMEEISNITHRSEFLTRVMSMMTIGPSRTRVVVDTADGERKPATGFRWDCPKK
jgi:hypothetical protein